MHVNFAFRQKTITKCVLNSGPVREIAKMVPALEKLSIVLLPLVHVNLEWIRPPEQILVRVFRIFVSVLCRLNIETL